MMKNFIICNVTGDDEINSEQMVRIWSTHEVNQNPLQILVENHSFTFCSRIYNDPSDPETFFKFLEKASTLHNLRPGNRTTNSDGLLRTF
jgi:hypothetical protein